MPWKAKPFSAGSGSCQDHQKYSIDASEKEIMHFSETVSSYLLCLASVKRKDRKSLKISRKQVDLEVEKKVFYFWK